MLYGRGAGSLPTGSALVSDVIYAATHSENKYSTFKNNATAEKDVTFVSDFRSVYYMRLTVSDRVGALSKITSILGKNDVSIVEAIQKGVASPGCVPLVIVTHETREHAIRNAVAKINALEGIVKVDSVLRVVS